MVGGSLEGGFWVAGTDCFSSFERGLEGLGKDLLETLCSAFEGFVGKRVLSSGVKVLGFFAFRGREFALQGGTGWELGRRWMGAESVETFPRNSENLSPLGLVFLPLVVFRVGGAV